MRSSFFRWRRIPRFALVTAVVLSPLTADAREEGTSAALAKALTVGTVVTVTQWSDRKMQGDVIELNDCVLTLRAWNEPIDVPIQSIRTIRRHQPKETSKAPGALSLVARYCENASCAPSELLYMSAAVVLKAFGGSTRSTKVVYRAKRPPVVPMSCVSPPALQ